MKTKPPSVRVLTAAIVAVFLVPITAGAGGPSPENTVIQPSTDTFKVSMTAYNAVPEQTSDHPDVTASGAFSNPDVVAARSQDLASKLPFGTVIEIVSASSSATCGYGSVGKLIGYRVIADTMNAEWHDKIDILLPKTDSADKNPAITLGLCKNVAIKVVGHIDVASIPKTQSELADALESSDQLAVAQ